jgi:hypothetical protein
MADFETNAWFSHSPQAERLPNASFSPSAQGERLSDAWFGLSHTAERLLIAWFSHSAIAEQLNALLPAVAKGWESKNRAISRVVWL